VVGGQQPVKEVRLYGKVQSDERMIQSQVAYIPGRIEKLLVNFTGESVRKGQTLAVIYSPELVTAQQELLETVKSKQSQPELYEAAKEKLRQWKISDSQIDAVETSGIVKANMEIKSTTNGIITSRRINSGDYVNQGTLLFEVSDLSHVWVQFDAYESDIQFLNRGNKLDFTFQALPGENYSGNIAFIDPSIDPVTRIAKVRVEINNPSGKLKPEMFATGIVKARMDEFRDKMVIPRSAVLWTGKRSVVYVKLPGNEPIFKIREIDLGPAIGDNYVVTNGLTKGEEIVTQGAFSVDAASQLEGKPSMMSQESQPQSPASMPGMDMGPGSSENGSASTMPIQTNQFKEISFPVAGNCEMCKDRIEKVVKSVAGIKSADWKIATKMLTVQLDEAKTSKETLQKAIAMAGHDTGKFKAPDDVYKKLPECCLYRAQ
jgi:Cu(I)/Ag(I) efflux system membrane fusion protein